MQGSPATNSSKTNEWDLDALLAEKRLDPVPVTLGGRTYLVRRNLRAREVDAFWATLNQNDPGQDVSAFAILFGDCDEHDHYDAAEATSFVKAADSLPLEHRNLVVRKVVIAAKLKSESDFPADVASGESKAS